MISLLYYINCIIRVLNIISYAGPVWVLEQYLDIVRVAAQPRGEGGNMREGKG